MHSFEVSLGYETSKECIQFLNNELRRKIKNKTLDKRDALTFPLGNFPFISSSIQASPAYGVYVIRYSRDCYSDCLDRANLLTQKVFKQSYVALV